MTDLPAVGTLPHPMAAHRPARSPTKTSRRSRRRPPESTPSSLAQAVGRRLRELRRSREGAAATLQAVAAEVGVTAGFLSMLERGTRAAHLDTLAKLAAVFGVPLADLFSFDADAEKVDALYRPLVALCREKRLSRRDVDKLVAMAQLLFS